MAFHLRNRPQPPTSPRRGFGRCANRQVERFAIRGHDLTQADGELTPTMKVKRAVIYDTYSDVFTGLYDRGQGPDNDRASRT